MEQLVTVGSMLHPLCTSLFSTVSYNAFYIGISFCIFSWIVMMVFLISGPIITWNLYHRKKPPCPSRLTRSSAASVTILRPLKGIDCNLEQNLESSFLQDYPNFEIIFCIASDKDPCIPIVRKLAAKHRHISCKLIIGDVNVGVNPKVNNLSRGYSMAKSDIVWILDSNVQMNHGALGRAVDLLTEPGVGLVIHLPCGVRPLSFGSLLDAVFLNSTHARMFSAINRLNVVSCVVGKSNLFRRSDLVDYGGLDGFGRYMSEDNMIGAALMVKGYRHRVAPDLAYQSLGYSTLKDYFSRRARWIRIRKYVVAVATMYEPFSESLIAGLTAGWAFQYTLGVPFWPFFILNMVAWFASDAFVVWVIHPDSVRGSGWTDFCLFALAWLARELSAIPVYIWAMSGSTVEWRGSRFYLHTDGTVEPLQPGLGPKRPVGILPCITDSKSRYCAASTVLAASVPRTRQSSSPRHTDYDKPASMTALLSISPKRRTGVTPTLVSTSVSSVSASASILATR
ncbi:hypothetical protein BASA60_010714 [Batrachochytrium salamandrivorans]|nr:hypothetical protein BASA60_010714 [Batrachochytrium salamandrivorans]